MATCTFDQLLYALRVSVEAANEGLRQRRTRQYQDGDVAGHALHVDVPCDASPDAQLESVVIPLSWFRDPRVPLVTEFAMAFDCRLRYARRRGRADELVIDLRPPRAWWFRRRRWHRLCISLRATDAWQPRVTLDGRAADVPTAPPGVT